MPRGGIVTLLNGSYVHLAQKSYSSGSDGGIVTLSDCKLFLACLHEAKPLTFRRAAIDNLPRFGVNPVNVTKPKRSLS